MHQVNIVYAVLCIIIATGALFGIIAFARGTWAKNTIEVLQNNNAALEESNRIHVEKSAELSALVVDLQNQLVAVKAELTTVVRVVTGAESIEKLAAAFANYTLKSEHQYEATYRRLGDILERIGN